MPSVNDLANMGDSMLEEVEVPAAQPRSKPEETVMTSYDYDPNPLQMPPPPEPPPKKNGRTKPIASDTTKKQQIPRIAKYLPDAEHVKVFKVDMGRRQFINTYGARDLSRAPDIEVFIQQFVMPTAGEGDYDVDVINSKGDATRTIPVSVLNPNKPPIGMNATQANESRVIDRFMDRMDKLEAVVMAPPPASKTFAEQIQEIAQVKGMLGVEEKSNDSITPMMLMMMMNQPKPEPQNNRAAVELAELKAELKAMREDRWDRGPQLPLPPPMPMPDPNAGIAEVVRALTEANTSKKDDIRLTDLLPILKPEKSFGLTEITAIIGMMTPILDKVFGDRRNPELDYLKDQIRDLKHQPTRGIQDTINDVSAVMSLARNLTGGSGEESNFWSFANRLIDNGPGFVEALSGMMGQIKEDENKQLGTGSTRGRGDDEDDDSDSDDEEGGELDFPPGFDEKVKAIADAKDAANRVGATLISFQFLGQKDKKWRKYLTQIVNLAKEGKKDEVMEFLVSFLDALKERGSLTDEVCKATIEAFDTHYERAVEVLTGSKKKPTAKE